MEIKLLNKESTFYSNDKNIYNFGVSFDLNEQFSSGEKLNTTKLIINYDISLFKNKNIKFGRIITTFEIDIPESIEFITLNESIRNNTLLHCLKLNHNNINQLIMHTLEVNGFKLINQSKHIIH